MKFFLILIAFTSINYSFRNNPSSDDFIKLYENGVSSSKIVHKLFYRSKKIEASSKEEILDRLIIKAKQCDDVKSLSTFLESKVTHAKNTDVMLLEDSIGAFLRQNHFEKYNKLEIIINQQYISYCQEYYPNINLELSFIYRNLHRYDQRYKQLAILKPNDKKYTDSLRVLSDFQDSITEKMLTRIINNYGIPGLKEVGPDANLILLFFMHLNSNFVIEHLSALQNAMLEQRLYISDESFKFLVDKTLHKCCNYVIYNTVWANHSKQITDPVLIQQIKTSIGIK